MANPRPLSIVKIKNTMLTDFRIQSWGLTETDRFIYYGEIAQDSTRCVIKGIYCGKEIPYLFADMFEEVDPTDF